MEQPELFLFWFFWISRCFLHQAVALRLYGYIIPFITFRSLKSFQVSPQRARPAVVLLVLYSACGDGIRQKEPSIISQTSPTTPLRCAGPMSSSLPAAPFPAFVVPPLPCQKHRGVLRPKRNARSHHRGGRTSELPLGRTRPSPPADTEVGDASGSGSIEDADSSRRGPRRGRGTGREEGVPRVG